MPRVIVFDLMGTLLDLRRLLRLRRAGTDGRAGRRVFEEIVE